MATLLPSKTRTGTFAARPADRHTIRTVAVMDETAGPVNATASKRWCLLLHLSISCFDPMTARENQIAGKKAGTNWKKMCEYGRLEGGLVLFRPGQRSSSNITLACLWPWFVLMPRRHLSIPGIFSILLKLDFQLLNTVIPSRNDLKQGLHILCFGNGTRWLHLPISKSGWRIVCLMWCPISFPASTALLIRKWLGLCVKMSTSTMVMIRMLIILITE